MVLMPNIVVVTPELQVLTLKKQVANVDLQEIENELAEPTYFLSLRGMV